MAKKDAYRVVLIEDNEALQKEMADVIETSKAYDLMTKFKSAAAAVIQSSVFKPNLFLINVDKKEGREELPVLVKDFPEAKILGTMKKWDNDIALECARLGATGCILKPFTAKNLTDSLEVFEKRGERGSTTTMAFFSPKGGSGKTTLIANLALHLAKESGASVAIIDADLQFGDMAIFFDLDPERTVLEAVRDINYVSPITLDPYFIPVVKNLRLLCCPRRPELAELVDIASLTAVVRMAQSLFRYVLIDLPFGYSPFSVGMCELSDVVYLVGMMNSGFEPAHMNKVTRMFEGWSSMKRVEMVFSKVEPCNEESRRKLARQLGREDLIILPDAEELLHQANSGRMARRIVGNSAFLKRIEEIADTLLVKGA